MAKPARVRTASGTWVDLAPAVADLSNYSTTSQMNTAITNGVGLVPILSQAIGSSVSSITVNNAFNSTYDNYKIIYSGGTGSNYSDLTLRLGSSTTGYYSVLIYGGYSSSSVLASPKNNVSLWQYAGSVSAPNKATYLNVDLMNPALASFTRYSNNDGYIYDGNAGSDSGIHLVETSYTGFTIGVGSGTVSGGTVYVYGYKK